MKKIITIIFLLVSAVCLGQTYKMNNNKVSINDSGVMTSQIVYGKSTFKDTACILSGGTNVIVSNGAGTLFHKTGANYITWSGDTAILMLDGLYIVYFSIYGTGGNGSDWEIKRANKRGASVTYGNAVAMFSTNGTNNYDGESLTAFITDGLVGDRVWLVLSRTGGSGDFTARTGRFMIIKQ